jgi:hypothetical protein
VHRRCASVCCPPTPRTTATETRKAEAKVRPNQRLQNPTFAQTVVIVRDTLQRITTSTPDVQVTMVDLIEDSKYRHLALGFHYDKEQIYRAVKALTDRARRRNRSNRRSARLT